MVYSTCSMNPIENEAVVAEVINIGCFIFIFGAVILCNLSSYGLLT